MHPFSSDLVTAHASDHLDRLLDEHGAAALLGYSIRALQNWRLRGGGPRFVKVSGRSVRYRRRDLNDWVEQRLRSSTADVGSDHIVSAAPLSGRARRAG
jgi:predicted DNA-binding transcriptional regulator AlpA